MNARSFSRHAVCLASPSPAATGVDPDKVARGKYLVTVAGCNDCHTPWKMGPNGPRART